VRFSLAALALIALTAGCGSGGQTEKSGAGAPPASLQALWKDSGASVALIFGTNDYSPGDVRISFLVVDSHGRVVAPPKAHVWIADSMRSKPSAQTIALAENVGVPGVTTNAPVKSLYVAHLQITKPGTYYVLARPIGGVKIGAVGQVQVRARSRTPAVGARAYPSKTPTLASAHGRTSLLTTRVPPDRGLLRYSIAGSLAAHVPFVVTFATPRWCSSRTCGPVVDVVDHERRHFSGTRIRFIHVEIYKDNDPQKGFNKWHDEWRLPTEPWTFLVGRDGKIKTKFAGSVSTRELAAAIRRYLL
jgi:hypothetical protein